MWEKNGLNGKTISNLYKIKWVDEELLMPILANPYPKVHAEESPMKSKAQRPTKKIEKQERSKERNERESDLQQNTDLQQNINLQQNTNRPQNTIL